MDGKKYYSLRDLSVELNIPKSTIVKYKDFYPGFFKMFGEGKRKKFDEMSLEVLRMIRELREEKNLDWMEIKQELESKFGEKIDAEEAEESAQRALAGATVARLDHLAHLFTALTGEVVKIGAQVRKLQEQADRNSKLLAQPSAKPQDTMKLARAIAALRHDTEMMFLEMMNRDNAGKTRSAEQFRDTIRELRGRFDAVQKSLDTLAATVRVAPPQANVQVDLSQSPDFRALAAKLERLTEDGAVNQSRYQILLKENELLKNKLREAARLQETEPQGKPQKQGIKGLFKKGRPENDL